MKKDFIDVKMSEVRKNSSSKNEFSFVFSYFLYYGAWIFVGP